jgi:hypothetical protein
MIRALLDGRKTQTRRVLKGAWQSVLDGHACDERDRVFTWFAPPDVPWQGIENQWAESGIWADRVGPRGYKRFLGRAPYRPGDRLWVREAWGYDWFDDGNTRAWKRVVYKADGTGTPMDNGDKMPWRSPIHMPRWASRLTLIVESVKVERLQDISQEDAAEEGVKCDMSPRSFVDHFQNLWERINGPGSWAANPWVAAIGFKVIRANIDKAEG